MKSDRKPLETLFKKHGFEDFKWLDPKDIVVAQWVRMKCMWGCSYYGKHACCPPNTPPVAECERFFREYKTAVVFHFAGKMEAPEDRHEWTNKLNKRLSKLEREIFLGGSYKAFLLFLDSCHLCDECATDRLKCKVKALARPSADALGVDVYETVRRLGYKVNVLSDYGQTMNRYAILLID